MTAHAAHAAAPMSFAASLRGQELGGYRLVTELGSGGMGTVFFAEAVQGEGRVAVKVLDPHFASDTTIVTRFFDEARAVHAIRHPNIVQIHATGADKGLHYLVMELLEGETLAEILERGPLALPMVRQVASEIASALDATHRQGIVHRDLKPENVFVTPRGVKVLDFGIAKLGQTLRSGGRTQTGTVLGTPAYMSPEQCLGESTLDAKSDLYSLAVLVYEMLAGRPPFRAESFGQYVICHVRETPPSLCDIDASLPPHVAQAVARGLAKEPGARHESASAFAKALTDRAACAVRRAEPDGRSQRLAKKLESIMLGRIARGDLRLPSMPETATKALMILRSTPVDFALLTSTIERDPLIAGHLLRVASSPAFGGRDIRSVRQAVPRFGVEPLREVLMQLAARSVFRSRVPRIDEAFRRIWCHGLAVGNVSRALAEALPHGPDPDAAYMAGLLHDVGKPVVGSFLLELERIGASGELDDDVWRRVVTHAHPAIGKMVSERWGLPDEIREAIGQGAFVHGGGSHVGNIVRFANALVERAGVDMSPINMEGAFEVVLQGRNVLAVDEETEKYALSKLDENMQSLAPDADQTMPGV